MSAKEPWFRRGDTKDERIDTKVSEPGSSSPHLFEQECDRGWSKQRDDGPGGQRVRNGESRTRGSVILQVSWAV